MIRPIGPFNWGVASAGPRMLAPKGPHQLLPIDTGLLELVYRTENPPFPKMFDQMSVNGPTVGWSDRISTPSPPLLSIVMESATPLNKPSPSPRLPRMTELLIRELAISSTAAADDEPEVSTRVRAMLTGWSTDEVSKANEGAGV